MRSNLARRLASRCDRRPTRSIRRALLASAAAAVLLMISTASAAQCQRCVPGDEPPTGGSTSTTTLLAQHYFSATTLMSTDWNCQKTVTNTVTYSCQRGEGSDRIKFKIRPLDPLETAPRPEQQMLKITLEQLEPLTWWKEVKVFDKNNQPVRSVSIQDQRGSAKLLVDMTGLEYDVGSMVLSKAGFLGFPVGRYQIGDLHVLAGKALTITWLQD